MKVKTPDIYRSINSIPLRLLHGNVLLVKAAFTDHAYLRADIRLSFDCKHFAFFWIYIEKDISLISASKYARSVKAAYFVHFLSHLDKK